MTIIDNDSTFTGSPLEILVQMRDASWMNPDMTEEEYLDFMCNNYYKLTGKRIEFSTEDLSAKCEELFRNLAAHNVIKILD